MNTETLKTAKILSNKIDELEALIDKADKGGVNFKASDKDINHLLLNKELYVAAQMLIVMALKSELRIAKANLENL